MRNQQKNCYPMNILIFAELFCQYSIIMRAQWWVIEIRNMECGDRKTRMTQQDWGKNDSFSDLYHAQWSWSQSGKQSWFGALSDFILSSYFTVRYTEVRGHPWMTSYLFQKLIVIYQKFQENLSEILTRIYQKF